MAGETRRAENAPALNLLCENGPTTADTSAMRRATSLQEGVSKINLGRILAD